MFIKIEIDSELFATYKLSKHDIIIGSSPMAAHIVITDKTISKKHARVVNEDGAWFVVDQGSTNGTFFDGQQLVPGKKIKIEEEDIVGLGSKVTMSLVSEADDAKELADPTLVKEAPVSSAQASISSESDRTRVISLDDLKNAKAVADQKRAAEQKAKRAAEMKKKKAEKDRMFKIILACAAVFGFGIYANNKWKDELKPKPRETIVKKIQQKVKADEEITTDIEGFRISRGSLLSRNKIIDLFKAEKCVAEETKTLCSDMMVFSETENGVVYLKPNVFVIFLEENEQMNLVKKQVSLNSVLTYDSLQKLAFFNVYKQLFTGKSVVEKGAYYFSFYRYNDEKQPQLNYVIAISGSSINILLQELQNLQFTATDEELKALIEKTDMYFTTY